MKIPRFIYFDLGNVLLNFDHDIACRELTRQTGVQSARIRQAIFDTGLQSEYERGTIDSQSFAKQVREQAEMRISSDDLLQICSDIFEVNSDVLPILSQLRNLGFRLGILSNTCQAHWEHVTDGRYASWIDDFELHVLSFEEKSMKPEPQIFAAAARKADVTPEEVFFTDDRMDNVQGARRAGLDAVEFRGAEHLIRDLRDRDVPV